MSPSIEMARLIYSLHNKTCARSRSLPHNACTRVAWEGPASQNHILCHNASLLIHVAVLFGHNYTYSRLRKPGDQAANAADYMGVSSRLAHITMWSSTKKWILCSILYVCWCVCARDAANVFMLAHRVAPYLVQFIIGESHRLVLDKTATNTAHLQRL